MKLRVGIVGLGDIAQKVYLPLLSGREEIELAGIMSRTEATVERIGAAYRVGGRYTELRDLLRQEPDAIFVHSPTGTHADIVLECLENGFPVYVDKPLSYDIRAAEKMAETAEKTGLLLGVGFNRRFAPLYVQAKEWLDEAGGFELCIAQKHRTRPQQLTAKETLYDDLIHILDLLLWLGGDTAELRDSLVRAGAAGELLNASGSLGFGQGGLGFFSMQRRAGTDLEKLELHGNHRSAEVANLEQATLYDKVTGERAVRFGSWDTILKRRGFAGAVDHFLQTLNRPGECRVSAQHVLPVHRLVEQLAL